MRCTIPVVVFLLFASLANGAPVRWEVSEGGNGHYYELVAFGSYLNWLQAFVIAQDRQAGGNWGHLATITSESEGLWLESVFEFPDQFWLGGWCYGIFPVGDDSGWRWITGEPWSHANWMAATEPAYDGTPHNRLSFYNHLNGHAEFGWNDVGRNYYLIDSFMVEYDGMDLVDIPNDHPVGPSAVSWGRIKALYR